MAVVPQGNQGFGGPFLQMLMQFLSGQQQGQTPVPNAGHTDAADPELVRRRRQDRYRPPGAPWPPGFAPQISGDMPMLGGIVQAIPVPGGSYVFGSTGSNIMTGGPTPPLASGSQWFPTQMGDLRVIWAPDTPGTPAYPVNPWSLYFSQFDQMNPQRYLPPAPQPGGGSI